MFDDIATYFCEQVVHSFNEYIGVKRSDVVGRCRDIRAAVNAAGPLYHFREHLPSPYKLSLSNIVAQCPDFRLLGDIVNTSKHAHLTRGNPQIKNATQICKILSVTEYSDNRGPYNGDEKFVVANLVNGQERDVLEVLINVMNFWQRYLHSVGIIQKAVMYSVPIQKQPRSRADCEETKVGLEAVQGLRYRQAFRFQKFNYAKGKVEPRDFTGMDVRFTICKPVEMSLILKNPSLGKEFKINVPLTPEEYRQLEIIQSPNDKEAYLESLPSTKKAVEELMMEAGLDTRASATQSK